MRYILIICAFFILGGAESCSEESLDTRSCQDVAGDVYDLGCPASDISRADYINALCSGSGCQECDDEYGDMIFCNRGIDSAEDCTTCDLAVATFAQCIGSCPLANQ